MTVEISPWTLLVPILITGFGVGFIFVPISTQAYGTLPREQIGAASGLYNLMQSTVGDEISEYHLQAGIASCHCAAKDYESTDWSRILSLYDLLIGIDDSPVVALNRAVAVSNVHGPRTGIEVVETIKNREQLKSYYLLYTILGEFEALLSNRQAAIIDELSNGGCWRGGPPRAG